MSNPKTKEYAGKILGHTEAHPQGVASTLPGDTVLVKPFCGGDNDAAQVTGNETGDGHYESVGGQPTWKPNVDESKASKRDGETRVIPRSRLTALQNLSSKGGTPQRTEVEDGTTEGRHTK